ncbi:hypothetical protein PG996_007511 [Apiospora saccharicola]|uniref:Uncharacterized protein n=1 Tax=Apiospora saccharicola TaxID=335842 RepID=A0ABR1VB14_9PEZI
MCLLYTQTQRCPSCKKTVWQSTAMYNSCQKPCSCVSCSPAIKCARSNRYSSEDEDSPKPTAEGSPHTISCPNAELIHGWPQWASQPCGFCRWQRSLEVRRQWHGVHFCMNPPTHSNKASSFNSPATPRASTHGKNEGSPKTPPEVVSDLSEGGWSQQSGNISSSSPKQGGRRKKSVRFQEPLKVEKKRSSIIARFTRDRVKTA